MDKISVIIPVYQVAKYINQCLDSIINQTYSELEIIIVDDGSTDGSGKICDEYAEKDSRIIVVHKKNEGLCSARNDGLAIATGKWIAFIDSDDWCDENYFSSMMESMNKECQVDILICGGHYLECEKKSKKKYNTRKNMIVKRDDSLTYVAKILAPNFMKETDNPASLGAPWDKLYRRDFLKKKKLFFDVNCKAWEDLLFNVHAIYEADILQLCSGSIGYHYRMVMSSITKKYNPLKPEINLYFINRLYEFALNKKITDELFFEAIHARSISLFSSSLRNCYLNHSNHMSFLKKIRQIKIMKKIDCYEQAIYEKNYRCFSKRQRVMQIILRQPFILPVILVIKLS